MFGALHAHLDTILTLVVSCILDCISGVQIPLLTRFATASPVQTDMRMHFDVVSKFSAITGSPGSQSEDEMMATLAMLLKCADLGHSCLPWNEHVRWFHLLEEASCLPQGGPEYADLQVRRSVA